MDLIGSILVTIVFGGLGAYALYHAFKPFKSNETFFEGLSGTDFFLLELIGDFLLWATKKLFPEHIHIKVYRVFAFLFGLLMFVIVIMFWNVF